MHTSHMKPLDRAPLLHSQPKPKKPETVEPFTTAAISDQAAGRKRQGKPTAGGGQEPDPAEAFGTKLVESGSLSGGLAALLDAARPARSDAPAAHGDQRAPADRQETAAAAMSLSDLLKAVISE